MFSSNRLRSTRTSSSTCYSEYNQRMIYETLSMSLAFFLQLSYDTKFKLHEKMPFCYFD